METMKMPKPLFEVSLVKKGRSHFYAVKKDEKEYLFPGVTGFLSIISKPALIPWATREALASAKRALMANLGIIEIDEVWIDRVIAEAKKKPDQIKDAAADLGTRVHERIDDYIKTGNIPILTEDEAPGFNNFIYWMKNSGIEIVMGDTAVASIKHGFGGKLDAVGMRNGELGILDWKTSNGIYSEYALQAGGAYAEAFFATYGIQPKWAAIARFGKTDPGDFEVKWVKSLPLALRAFLLAKDLNIAMKEEMFCE